VFRFEERGELEFPNKVAGMGVIVAKEWDWQIGCMLGRLDAIILAEYGCNSHFFSYIAPLCCCYLASQLKSSATDGIHPLYHSVSCIQFPSTFART
jgi:hypothetical protein